METIGAKRPQSVSFRVAGGLAATQVHIWETNSTHIFEHMADVQPVNGIFQYAFEPESLYSLSTTAGQGKGGAEPPPEQAFPLPYADDFEGASLGHAPKYLSDQDGAFEVRSCEGRPGQCLEQVISGKPIPWGPLPDPFTLAGNARWTDYSVSTDVHFLTSAPAVVMGRIDSADVFQDDKARWPSGYILRIKSERKLGTAFDRVQKTLSHPCVRVISTGSASVAPSGIAIPWSRNKGLGGWRGDHISR